MEADRSLHGRHVVAAIARAIEERGKAPRSITLDNGNTLASELVDNRQVAIGAPVGQLVADEIG
jgi:hypothetical protein